MSDNTVLNKLKNNTRDVSNEAVRLLLKIADNILKNPTNIKLRTLPKSNAIISQRILSVQGGVDCLKLMGFEENPTSFVLPSKIPLSVVKNFQKALITWNNTKFQEGAISKPKADNNQDKPNESQGEKSIKPIVLPPLVLKYTNPFLKTIERHAHKVLQYENKELQARARNLIPLVILEENAQKTLRSIQESVKKNKLPDPDLSVQDTLLLELLTWFKNDFFVWVNSPECSSCGGECKFSHISKDPKLLIYTDRVELHRCNKCGEFTPFPRYSDLNIVLETRRGRCGEWANTFTLLCRSLGWDARLVVEENDHLWTEVYSIAQKRFLHCDPCENICDTPLVYENGWNKQISYVMAYSAEEVQDVTWRYSSKHKEVLERREKCTEAELLDAIINIRNEKQKQLSEARRRYLIKRSLLELVEFLVEKKPGEQDKIGRSSGSSAWRLARGEIQADSVEYLNIWKISPDDIVKNSVILSYFPALNKYVCSSEDKIIKEIQGWCDGAYKHSGIFRNEEKDWKMVYLSRKEGVEIGEISWKFTFSKFLDSVKIRFDYRTFENGEVNVKVCSETACQDFPKGENEAVFTGFTNAKQLSVVATLSGGKGDAAWQHAQLFRQSVDCKDAAFQVTLQFK